MSLHFSRLIGIIICTSFQREQENVNLTLAANFGYLLRDFMEQLGTPITMLSLPREPSDFACMLHENCILRFKHN